MKIRKWLLGAFLAVVVLTSASITIWQTQITAGLNECAKPATKEEIECNRRNLALFGHQ